MSDIEELTKGLSKKQKEAFLTLLDSEEWMSAYQARTSLSTLNSLVKLGIVSVRHDLGSLAFPRNSIFFKSKFRLRRDV